MGIKPHRAQENPHDEAGFLVPRSQTVGFRFSVSIMCDAAAHTPDYRQQNSGIEIQTFQLTSVENLGLDRAPGGLSHHSG
jgi:hypothetical protein